MAILFFQFLRFVFEVIDRCADIRRLVVHSALELAEFIHQLEGHPLQLVLGSLYLLQLPLDFLQSVIRRKDDQWTMPNRNE